MAGDIKTIQETSDYVVACGKDKINKKLHVLLLQGILAGIFIALGAIGYFKVAALATDPGVGVFLASAIFPVGIIAILMLGSELFTSDTMMIMGFYDRQYSLLKVLKILALVWIANFIGMIFISWITAQSGIFNEAMTNKIIHTAEVKTTMSISQLLFSAILCNIIVCTGVWTAYAMNNIMAKIVTLWFIITVFVLSGTEHIIANMFYLFTSYMLGADITISGIGYNLLWVTIGNIIGGAVIVTGINKLIRMSRDKKPKTGD